MAECDAVRPRLVNLVDAVPADLAPAARDAVRVHVKGCRSCETALAELVLTGYAVRRGLASAGLVEPPADAWPRLRTRVSHRSPGLGFAGSSLAGLVVSAAVALMLVVPLSLPKPSPEVTQEVGLEVIVTSGVAAPDLAAPDLAAPNPIALSSGIEDRIDAQWLIANLQARRDATPPDLALAASPRDQLLRYGETSETEPAVPEDGMPRVQVE